MPWLNYHHLRYFWTVAREGNLARAAARLRVSPPSISGQIRELEEALGEKLFRREGRRNVLTDVGQMVMGYADEIFTLGDELLGSLTGQAGARALRLHVGVVDSLPKLITQQILRPVFDLPQRAHLVCREGKLEDLLGQLLAHRLDLVLTDEPASGGVKVRMFNHRLGESGLTLCAAPRLARRLRRGFPRSLQDAPALLPSANTSLRRSLEQWLASVGVFPQVLAEFEDLALMKAVAADGRGFIVLPTAAVAEARERFGFAAIGKAGNYREVFYAITVERRIVHPAVAEITSRARQFLS